MKDELIKKFQTFLTPIPKHLIKCTNGREVYLNILLEGKE